MHDLQIKYRPQIEEITEAAIRLGELGYVTSHGGNLSYRVDRDLVLITATKTLKRKLTFDDIVIIDFNCRLLFAAAGRKPTGESPFHLRILKSRPDLNAVIHAHPPVLTGFSISNPDLLSRPFLPEPVFEVGPVLPVDYAEPLSEELAGNFDRVIHRANAFLMKNHGFLICSRDGVLRALEMLEMVETSAYSLLVALSAGKVNEISETEIQKLERTLKVRALPLPGAPGAVNSLRELYFK